MYCSRSTSQGTQRYVDAFKDTRQLHKRGHRTSRRQAQNLWTMALKELKTELHLWVRIPVASVPLLIASFNSHAQCELSQSGRRAACPSLSQRASPGIWVDVDRGAQVISLKSGDISRKHWEVRQSRGCRGRAVSHILDRVSNAWQSRQHTRRGQHV